MERDRTAQGISSDVNKALLNHFIYGWEVTDKTVSRYFAEFDDDEWNYYSHLWNSRSNRLEMGLLGYN